MRSKSSKGRLNKKSFYLPISGMKLPAKTSLRGKIKKRKILWLKKKLSLTLGAVAEKERFILLRPVFSSLEGEEFER